MALPRQDAAGIELLLHAEPELASALHRTPTAPFDGDDDYLLAAELGFTIQSLHLQALGTLRSLVVGGGRQPIYADRAGGDELSSACSPTETAQRVATLRAMRDIHAAAMARRLARTTVLPRVVAAADAYGLSAAEASVLELLVLQRCHRTALFASCLQHVAEDQVLTTLSGATSLELAAFLDEERSHVKEGVVLVEEDYGTKTASLSAEACRRSRLSLQP